jgi:outer membrane murein-binding lipoprotein Lpp
MPYTKSLIKLTDITDMKIAKTMSESDVLNGKVQQLEAIKNQLDDEIRQCRLEMERLVNEKLNNIRAYYKTRSEISIQGSRLVTIEARIDNIEADIKELNDKIDILYQETLRLKRKKRKYNRILLEGI